MENKEVYKKIDIFDDSQGLLLSSDSMSLLDDRIILFGDNLNIIPHKTVVRVIGYLEDGIIYMNGKVTLSTTSQLNLDIIKADGKRERRAYLKVKTNFNANLVKTYALGKSNRCLFVNENVITRDISLGGICFYSNKTILKNQKLILDLNHIQSGFVAESIVLRREKESQRSKYKYRYGCRFIKLNNEQQRILCEYVFRVQIEARKKEKEFLLD